MEFKNKIIKLAAGFLMATLPLIVSAQSGPERVRMLVNALEHDNDFKVRIAAAQALAKLADGTVADWMIRAFRHDDNDAVRLTILYAVAEIPDEKIVPPLIELANQEILSPKERLVIEQILWNFRECFHVSSWIAEALNSNEISMKKTAVWVLGIVGEETMVPIFEKLTGYPMEDIQAMSLESLSKIGDAKALAVCQAFPTESVPPQVKRAAQHCILSNQLLIQNPNARVFRKKMPIALDTAKKKCVKPSTYLTYLNKNVNQREVDVALTFLQPQSSTANAVEKPIKLIQREKINTFQLIVDMVSQYDFDIKDLEVLKTIIRENSNGIDGCYLRELPNSPALKGDIKTFFKILRTGEVSHVKITDSTLNNNAVEKCILEELNRFEFPSLPLEHVDLVYTFSFTPPGKTTVIFH